jgi:hypothetical protein
MTQYTPVHATGVYCVIYRVESVTTLVAVRYATRR